MIVMTHNNLLLSTPIQANGVHSAIRVRLNERTWLSFIRLINNFLSLTWFKKSIFDFLKFWVGTKLINFVSEYCKLINLQSVNLTSDIITKQIYSYSLSSMNMIIYYKGVYVCVYIFVALPPYLLFPQFFLNHSFLDSNCYLFHP